MYNKYRGVTKKTIGAGLLAAVGIVVLLAPFASPLPDGLEKAAEGLGVRPEGAACPMPFSLPYTWWGGILGTIAVFAAVILLGRLLGKRP